LLTRFQASSARRSDRLPGRRPRSLQVRSARRASPSFLLPRRCVVADAAVIEEAHQPVAVIEAIADGLGDRRTTGDFGQGSLERSFQRRDGVRATTKRCRRGRRRHSSRALISAIWDLAAKLPRLDRSQLTEWARAPARHRNASLRRFAAMCLILNTGSIWRD